MSTAREDDAPAFLDSLPATVVQCAVRPTHAGSGFSHVTVELQRESGFTDLAPDRLEATFCYTTGRLPIQELHIETLRFAQKMIEATIEKLESEQPK